MFCFFVLISGCQTAHIKKFDSTTTASEAAILGAKHHSGLLGKALIDSRVMRQENNEIKTTEFWFLPGHGVFPSSANERHFITSMANYCSNISGNFIEIEIENEINIYLEDQSIPEMNIYRIANFQYLTKAYDCTISNKKPVFRLYYNTDDITKIKSEVDVVAARILNIEPKHEIDERHFIQWSRTIFADTWNTKWVCELVPRRRPWTAVGGNAKAECL